LHYEAGAIKAVTTSGSAGKISIERPRRWLRTAGLGRLLPRGCASLASKVHEIFLARLECCGIGAGGTFRVHREPDRPDDNPNDASGDILHDLRILLRCKGFGPTVIGLNFGVLSWSNRCRHLAAVQLPRAAHLGRRMPPTPGQWPLSKICQCARRIPQLMYYGSYISSRMQAIVVTAARFE
jgi:hypothetical protein